MQEFERKMNGEKRHLGKQQGRHLHENGAQTFRRGRALEFLNQLFVKRDTLRQQLEAPQYQEIKLVIQGELKAIEEVINDYTQHFGLYESENL